MVQGQLLGAGKTLADAVFTPASPLGDRLFRNDLTVRADGTRTLRFTDVTEASGIDVRDLRHGRRRRRLRQRRLVDLYLHRPRAARSLLRNNGDGTFADVTAKTGVGDPGGWGVSAAFVDYDRDGWLDLFVGNYVDYRIEARHRLPDRDRAARLLRARQLSRAARPPLSQPRRRHVRGRVGARRWSAARYGPALGVSTADFDGDGWLDIYVANDGEPNQLWINQRERHVRGQRRSWPAPRSTATAAPRPAWAIDAGDFDNDGDEDLFVTNWLAQMNILYVNDGRRRVRGPQGPPRGSGRRACPRPASAPRGSTTTTTAGSTCWPSTAACRRIEAQARAGDPFPLPERDQLFRNLGDGRFEDVSAAGRARSSSVTDVGRGAAFGDVDNDGDTDVVVGDDGRPRQLLVNNVGNRNHWLGLRLVGRRRPRDMLGARVGVVRPDGTHAVAARARRRQLCLGQRPARLVGLGTEAPAALRVRVQWPDGTSADYPSVPANRWTTLTQGQAAATDGASR